jgi:hypothetical protein
MQWHKFNMSEFTGAGKNPGRCIKSTSDELDGSVFRQLLAASKDAEFLIGCLFELHFITAAPLQQIWDKLAVAIAAAQQTLQAEHPAQPNQTFTNEFICMSALHGRQN